MVHLDRFVAFLIIVSATAFAPRAGAHPFGVSGFDARTSERELAVEFRLDLRSVIDLVTRLRAGAAAGAADVPREKPRLLSYLDRRFLVKNGGEPCRRDAEPARFELDLPAAKLCVSARYRCARALDEIRLESTLFLDEGTPHQLIGNLSHEAALERYFFTGGERVATIRLRDLRQHPSLAARAGGFRMATPPASYRPVAPGSKPSVVPAAAAGAAPSAVVTPVSAFIAQGLRHVLSGLDHVLFVVLLALAAATLRELALLVTAFTAAHSVTLALAAFGLVSVSPVVVEPLIALSIVYVAVTTLKGGARRELPRSRAGVTFGFGLFHGLGFGSALHDVGLSRGDLARALLGFNLGVELAQLAVVVPAFAVLCAVRTKESLHGRVRLALCGVAALVGIWLFPQQLI